MTTRIFLGANSGAGFHSFYDSFARSAADFTYLIKAGPGGGKSSFMRRIAQEAEKRGLDVQCVLCSGDPDSLDGIYIPELHIAITDATAPHAAEPEYFGAQACYVNLGEFCAAPRGDKSITELTRKYKDCYARAYRLLSAAEELSRYQDAVIFEPEVIAAVEKLASGAILRELEGGDRNAATGESSDCFLSCISCRGVLRLNDTAHALCKHIYLLDDKYRLAHIYLDVISHKALEYGESIIRCHEPLCPDNCEAILLPDRSLGFVSSSLCKPKEPWRHVRLDALIPSALLLKTRRCVRHCWILRSALINEAVSELKEAKRFHDELETAYRPYVDFDRLGKFTDAFIAELF